MDKVKLSLDEKIGILRKIFGGVTNPKIEITSKFVMMDWYDIRPGMRDGIETITYAIRKRDHALCAFRSMPIGTEDDDHFHALDNIPDLEIIPLPNNVGFDISMNARRVSSHDITSLTQTVGEIVFVLKDFFKEYKSIIQSQKLSKES